MSKTFSDVASTYIKLAWTQIYARFIEKEPMMKYLRFATPSFKTYLNSLRLEWGLEGHCRGTYAEIFKIPRFPIFVY